MSTLKETREQQEVALERLRKLQRDRSMAPLNRKEAIDKEISTVTKEISDIDNVISDLINNGRPK